MTISRYGMNLGYWWTNERYKVHGTRCKEDPPESTMFFLVPCTLHCAPDSLHILRGSELSLQPILPVQLEDAGNLAKDDFREILRRGFADGCALEPCNGFDRFRSHGRMNGRRLPTLQTSHRSSFRDKDRKPLCLVNSPATAALFKIDPVAAQSHGPQFKSKRDPGQTLPRRQSIEGVLEKIEHPGF